MVPCRRRTAHPCVPREFLFEVGADLGVVVREAVLQAADLTTVDEPFITSTNPEIVPAVAVGEHTIGAGPPGPMTSAAHQVSRAGGRARTHARSADSVRAGLPRP